MYNNIIRRDFFKILSGVVASWTVKDKLDTPPEDYQHVIIFKEEQFYSCFPNLYQLEDGRLYTEFSTREVVSHIDPRGGTRRMISDDGGQSWIESDREFYNPKYRSADGTLSEANAFGWRYVSPGKREEIERQGIEVRNSPNGQVAYAIGCYARTSADNGKTWDQREVDHPPKGLIMTFLDACTYVRLNDQVILRSIYGRPVAKENFYESWLLRSTDNGRNWSFHTVAADADRVLSFGETAIVQLAADQVLAVMRLQPNEKWKERGEARTLYTCRSMDGGKTWSQPMNSGIEGYPASVIVLKDGKLLCTYGYRDEPMGIRAVVSEDRGETWNLDQVRIIRDDGWGRGSDLGYPISVQRKDGKIFTIYYFTGKDRVTHIAGTLWEL